MSWDEIKNKLNHNRTIPHFHEGDIWWTCIGQNIGIEINGKGEYFTRPVLIIRKLSSTCFIGVPLTSQRKGGSWYINFPFRGSISSASLANTRSFSVYRLHQLIGEADRLDLVRVREGYRKLIFGY